MNRRVAIACALVSALTASGAMAGERPRTTAAPADPAATRARLDALRGQEKHQTAEVRQLKTRVDSLEAQSKDAGQALAERDRRIAELQRQLAAMQGE